MCLGSFPQTAKELASELFSQPAEQTPAALRIESHRSWRLFFLIDLRTCHKGEAEFDAGFFPYFLSSRSGPSLSLLIRSSIFCFVNTLTLHPSSPTTTHHIKGTRTAKKRAPPTIHQGTTQCCAHHQGRCGQWDLHSQVCWSS